MQTMVFDKVSCGRCRQGDSAIVGEVDGLNGVRVCVCVWGGGGLRERVLCGSQKNCGTKPKGTSNIKGLVLQSFE